MAEARTLQQQVIEVIVDQAVTQYATGSYRKWADYEDGKGPLFGESWFWGNFEHMVDEAIMALKDAVEGWVTIQYEEDIIDIVDRTAP